MESPFSRLPFGPTDILLPRDCDLTHWSVVACDQYTSQPDYWQRVEQLVGEAPSTLRLILPENRLEQENVDREIEAIHETAQSYLDEGRFRVLNDALIYVERTLSNGLIRRGLVGAVDLEAYDHTPGMTPLIRATEGTVLSRVPPRMAVRQGAPVEMSHAILLMDDPANTVIEPLAGETGDMEQVYDFELMEGGGHIRGWLLKKDQMERVAQALEVLARREQVPLFAVGDGNHSLAAAKACWENCRAVEPEDSPRRFALVEVEDLYDPALVFEPIHRVVFHVDPEELLRELSARCPIERDEKQVRFFCADRQGSVSVPDPGPSLEVAFLQAFLDDYLAAHPEGRVDYVHGADVAQALAKKPGVVAFLLPAMDKRDLFPAVFRDGALPRKTFSMGEARDKRFYLEGRALRDLR